METEDRAYKLKRCLRKIDHLIWKTNEVILKETGLTHAELNVLFTVYHYSKRNTESPTASKLAEMLEVTIPAVMHKLTVLEKEEYIVRDYSKEDRRKRFITITDKWLDVVKKLDTHEEMIINEFLLTLAGQGKVLVEVLDDFAKYLEGETEKYV